MAYTFDGANRLVVPTTTGFVYCVRNRVNDKRYIGQTVRSVDARWRGHVKGAVKGSEACSRLYNAIRKHGVDVFEHEWTTTVVIEDVGQLFPDEPHIRTTLDAVEVMFIEIYDTTDKKFGYNVRLGGSGGRLCDATKRKISETLTGRKKSLATRSKMSAAWWGHKVADETRQKISEANRRRDATTISTKCGGRLVHCIELDRTFVSAKAAQRELRREGFRVNNCSIGACIRGRQATHCGMHWKPGEM